MAEIQTEWALVFKTEELDAGMQHVKDVSNDTTKSIGEGWNTTGTAAVDALKKLLAQSEETHGRTKEQVEKASQAVDLLGDALGIKVPAALQKMAAESEVAGPIMESAFPVLAAVALASMIVDIIGKIGDWISSLRELSDEEKNAINAQANDFKKSIEFAHKITELRRQALLVGKSEVEQARLRAQFAHENEEEDKGYLGRARKEYAAAQALLDESEKHETRKVETGRYQPKTGLPVVADVPVISDDQIKNAKRDILDLQELWGKGLEDLQQETALAGERRNLADAQAAQANLNIYKQHINALKALHQQTHGQNQAEVVSLDDILHKQNKIVVAKKDATQAGKEEVTVEQALAVANVTNLKVVQQQAEFGQKNAEDSAKIAQLNRDINDKQAEHNAALAVALGYTTQEKADAQALATLEKDKSTALTEANNRLTAQQAIVKQLGIDTMNGMLGSPEQKAAFQKAILDFQKLKIEELNLEKKYDDQIAALRLKLANTSSSQLRKQLLDWQDVNKQLTQSFMQTLNGFNSSLAAFVITGTGNWKQFAASAIESILQIGLQYEESKLLMMIMDKLGAKTKLQMDAETGLAQIEIASDIGAANAYAAWADMPAVAAGMAAAAKGIISGFGVPIAALGAKSSAGGDWRVDTDRLNFVHKDETILPAGIAGKLRNMVENGSPGSGVTVVVNHSVSAVDAASFQGHIRRHSNMIANEVTRALKRKGAR
jgi:hypothetical protein